MHYLPSVWHVLHNRCSLNCWAAVVVEFTPQRQWNRGTKNVVSWDGKTHSMWNVGKVPRGNGMYLSAWASAWSFWCRCQHWRRSAAAARGSEHQWCVMLIFLSQLKISSACSKQETAHRHSWRYTERRPKTAQHALGPDLVHQMPSHERLLRHCHSTHHDMDSLCWLMHALYWFCSWLSLRSCSYLSCP